MKGVITVIILSIVLGVVGVWYLLYGGWIDKQFEMSEQLQKQAELQNELIYRIDSLMQIERIYFAQQQQQLVAARDSIILTAVFDRYSHINLYSIFNDSSELNNQIGLGGGE